MARFQLLLMVTVFGVGCWNCALAALATTIEHLPEEQNTHRHHAYQKQDSQPHKKSASMTSTTGPTGTEPAYQLEHGQSEAKARQYVASMTDEQLLAPAWCKECNATVLHYCRTSRFLNDHCCCEYSHARAALATTIEHLPEEQHTHRHHAYQKQDSQPHKKSASMTSTTGPTGTEPAYQLEHGQSEAKARQYVASMTDEQLLAPAWCKECNATVLHYCRTSRFLNDHCCCEYSHARGLTFES
uniref:CCC domain-containing protein n=1 Tax=Anopheles culicifacies TaxID=139723 RepID=A0A182MNR5_9DIPT